MADMISLAALDARISYLKGILDNVDTLKSELANLQKARDLFGEVAPSLSSVSTSPTGKRRGRKPGTKMAKKAVPVVAGASSGEAPKRARGRPRKNA